LSARQNQIWSYAKKDGVYTGETSTRYSTANTNMVKRKGNKKRIVVTNIIGKKREVQQVSNARRSSWKKSSEQVNQVLIADISHVLRKSGWMKETIASFSRYALNKFAQTTSAL
jgi:hypothetical protein